MSDWYGVDFGIVTAKGTDITAYLNASVNFTALLTSKPKAWQSSFATDKGCKSFFFISFLAINPALEKKGSKNDFYPPLT